jgi:UDP-N-acetylmuramoyl-L-alanyl-D-glutamate--2,6-diaminopimelate ligase
VKRTLAELVRAIGLDPQPQWRGIEVAGITEDSRRVRPGELFVAIRGFVADGHAYVGEAVGRGAAAVVVEEETLASVPCIRVPDGRRALAALAVAFFDDPTRKLFTVGVTGTKGKTTVCHLIAHLLGEGVTCLLSTVANEERNLRAVTTPASPIIQEAAWSALRAGQKNFVLEVSSAALALHRTDGVDFDAAVFTNLTHDHLDFHKTTDEYLAAKLLLFRGLKESACAIVNADDAASEEVLAATRAERITYAIEREADVRALDIRSGPRATDFILRVRGETVPVRLFLPGEHNVENALAAAAVGVWCGLLLDEVAAKLESAQSVAGRYQFFRAKSGATVVVDFAHSPDSLERMLRSLRPFHRRVISLFGCGGESDRAKRPIMGGISGRLADMTILTSDNPKSEDPNTILDEIEEGIRPTGGAYERILERREAIRRALKLAGAGDVVLLAGKGHETYQIVGHDFLPYSDAEFLHEEDLVD